MTRVSDIIFKKHKECKKFDAHKILGIDNLSQADNFYTTGRYRVVYSTYFLSFPGLPDRYRKLRLRNDKKDVMSVSFNVNVFLHALSCYMIPSVHKTACVG